MYPGNALPVPYRYGHPHIPTRSLCCGAITKVDKSPKSTGFMALFTPMLNSLPRRMLTKIRKRRSLESVFDYPNFATECHYASSIQELIVHLSNHRWRNVMRTLRTLSRHSRSRPNSHPLKRSGDLQRRHVLRCSLSAPRIGMV